MAQRHEVLAVEWAWCPECCAECAVEIAMLAGDPEPVAICLHCSGGVEIAWQPGADADGIPGLLAAHVS